MERPDVAAKSNKSAPSSKSRNGDRRSGKAWGKNHDKPVKTLTREQQERKAHKATERESNKKRPSQPGPAYTMPKITWEWAAETLAGRHQNTRKSKIVARCLEYERAVVTTNKYDDPTVVTKEAKPPKKNGR